MRRLQWKRHRPLLPMDRRRTSPPPRLTAPEESWYEIRDCRLLGHCIHCHKRHSCSGWHGTGAAKKVGGLRQHADDTHFTNESACADDFAAQAAIGSPNSWGHRGCGGDLSPCAAGRVLGPLSTMGRGVPAVRPGFPRPGFSMAMMVRFRSRLRQIENAAVVIKGNVHRRCG
jgi:hypothetical protein